MGLGVGLTVTAVETCHGRTGTLEATKAMLLNKVVDACRKRDAVLPHQTKINAYGVRKTQ